MKQLLIRCNFGASETDIETILSEKPFHPPLKTYTHEDYPVEAGDPDHEVKIGETWVNNITRGGAIKGARRDSLRLWWLQQVFKGDMHDVMTFFWHNHFGVDIDGSGYEPHFCWKYYLVLRSNAMGDFKKMIYEVTLSAAMMYRLNGESNIGSNPNKNFARELVELFTLDLGNYTEQDIVEMAKCFSGWWIDYNTGICYFSAANHDNSDKVFSSHFQGRVIKGSGEAEVQAVIDMIFETQPDTLARFICSKLYRFFINATVNEAFIGMMANVFIQSGFNIKAVLRFMLTSDHFNDPMFHGSIVKSPLDLMASVMRDFKVKFPTDPVKLYWSLNKLRLRLEPMIRLGDPPSIEGWKPYTQGPEYDALWYNASTAQMREQLLIDLFSPWLFSLDGEGFWIDAIEFTGSLPNPQDPNSIVDVVTGFLPFQMSAEEKQKLKTETLLSGQLDDSYWTRAWNRYLADSTKANRAAVEERLISLFKYIILSEQYQLK